LAGDEVTKAANRVRKILRITLPLACRDHNRIPRQCESMNEADVSKADQQINLRYDRKRKELV
jgi:hypothetical protein